MRSSRLERASTSSACRGAAAMFQPPLLSRSMRRFGFVDQDGKSGFVLQRDLGQHLAIQIDAALLQTADEFTIRNSRGPASGADAHDPQRTEIALLQAASLVRVALRLLDRFLRGAVEFALGQEKAGGAFERLVAVLSSFWSSFNSWHVFTPLWA